jgi:uncharacterized protein (TIGR03437 family)
MHHHRTVRQSRSHLDVTLDYNLPPGQSPAMLRIQRGVPGTTGPVMLEIPVSSAATGGSIELSVPSTPDNHKALTEIQLDPERFYAALYTPSGGFIRGQLADSNPAVLMGVMSPANEVPAIASLSASAIGAVIAIITRDPSGVIISGQLTFDVVYQFPSPVTFTGLHVHHGAAGVNGPVILDSGLRAPPAGTTSPASGRLRLRSEMDVSKPEVAAALDALQNDPSNYYINLHTTNNPAGAVRAQLRPTERASYQSGYATVTGDPRIADAAYTLNLLRSVDGVVEGAVATIDVDYADYPLGTKFIGDIAATIKEGTGNLYSVSALPPDQLKAVDSRLLLGYRCIDLATEDKVPIACDGNNDKAVHGNLRISAIISSASDPGVLIAAPGEVIAIYGNFPGQPSFPGTLINQSWPLSANGLEVTIGEEQTEGCGTTLRYPVCKVVSGLRAPLAFVTWGQINAQVPFELPQGRHRVRVWNRSFEKESTYSKEFAVPSGTFYSDGFILNVEPVAPAIFLGVGGPQIYNEDLTPNTPDTAAEAGAVLTIYAAGLGQTEPKLLTGRPAPADPFTVSEVAVSVDSKDVPALSAQAVPASIGVYSVTFKVPAGVTPGLRPVSLKVKGKSSNTVRAWFR